MSINGDLADSEYGDDFIEHESFSDTTSEKYDSKADKRAHHNALERKRRDHIKDSFSSLKNAVPTFSGEKASRAQILKKAAEYISMMRNKNQDHQKDIDVLKKENKVLEEKIRALEQMKSGTISLSSSLDQANSFGNLIELDNNQLILDDLDKDHSNIQNNKKLVTTSTAYITNNNQLTNIATNSPKRRKI